MQFKQEGANVTMHLHKTPLTGINKTTKYVNHSASFKSHKNATGKYLNKHAPDPSLPL